MANNFRLRCLCISFLAAASYTDAQTIRVPSPPLPRPAAPAPSPAGRSGRGASIDLAATFISNTQIDLSWTASTADGSKLTEYKIHRCDKSGACKDFNNIGDSTTIYSDKGLTALTPYTYRIDASDADSKSVSSNTLNVTTTRLSCYLFPTRSGCMNFGPGKNANINAFYQTNGSLSFFNQIKSIYNRASGSATVSADLATLNFSNGMQVAAATNIQAGSSGTTAPSSGTVPTLSANGAGQATQNLLYGGTFLASELYPFVAAGGSKLGSAGGLGFLVDLIAKEGFDIQNFKSGTDVNVSSPPFHGSAQMEGYLQYNSINLASDNKNFAGALFVGGSYGYSYMSHGYAREYGFGNSVNNGIGQISFGILINGVAKISVSRAFGPSQTYIDSTTMAQTTVNNFRAWSFGVTYQSPTPAK